jgi:hypothetical protein
MLNQQASRQADLVMYSIVFRTWAVVFFVSDFEHFPLFSSCLDGDTT